MELGARSIPFRRQVLQPAHYKSKRLKLGYRMDFIVDGGVIVEVKAVEKIHPIHEAQLLTYLKLTGLDRGLLLNFCAPTMKDGIRRFVNGYPGRAGTG